MSSCNISFPLLTQAAAGGAAWPAEYQCMAGLVGAFTGVNEILCFMCLWVRPWCVFPLEMYYFLRFLEHIQDMKALNLCLGLNECSERQAKASRRLAELGAQGGRHFHSVRFFSLPYLEGTKKKKKRIKRADPHFMKKWQGFFVGFFSLEQGVWCTKERQFQSEACSKYLKFRGLP